MKLIKNTLIALSLLILVTIPALAESWKPIARTVPQYVDSNGDPYSGAVIKFYSAGTTTTQNLATDNTGATTATSVQLNANGYPEISSNVIIPHVKTDYKIALYPTQAAADSDSGAIWTIDNMTSFQEFLGTEYDISSPTTITTAYCSNLIRATGTTTITLMAISSVANDCFFYIRNDGSGIVTIDGDGSETINSETTIDISPNGSAIITAGDTDWISIGNDDAQLRTDNNFTAENNFKGEVRYPDDGELTISSGSVTPTGVFHTIDTESDAATDNLDTIANGADGQLLFLQTDNDARDVTFTSAGNITVPKGGDLLFTSATQLAGLVYSSATSKWAMFTTPPFGGNLIDIQDFTVSGTWTRPNNCNTAEVWVTGGGGGGGSGDADSGGVSGSNGGNSSFGSHATGNGGSGGGDGDDIAETGYGGGGGSGTVTGGSVYDGGDGHTGFALDSTLDGALGGGGGASFWGGGGFGGGTYGGVTSDNGSAGQAYGSGGGAGAGSNNSTSSGGGGGGGAGGTAYKYITSGLGATETVTIGAGGAGGNGGYGDGAAGKAGYILVKCYY